MSFQIIYMCHKKTLNLISVLHENMEHHKKTQKIDLFWASMSLNMVLLSQDFKFLESKRFEEKHEDIM